MSVIISGAGGAGVTGNGTINQIPLWTNTTQLGNSVLRQVTASIIVGATDPSAAAAETFRTMEGLISDTGVGHDNVRLGRGAAARAAVNARNVVIGTLASSTAGASSVNNVVIGYLATIGMDQGSSVVIGDAISWPTNTAGPAILIGSGINASFPGIGIGISCTPQGSGVLIGNQSTTGAVNNYIGVGRSVNITANNAVALGDAANVAHTSSIAIGRSATSLIANQLVIGALNLGIANVLIGEGNTKAGGAALTYRHTDGSGVDDPAADVTYQAARPTGNAVTAGRFVWQTGIPGATGAALQALETRLEIRPAATGAAAVNIVCTGGVGAAVGTLNNSPAAGDPTVWFQIQVNGVAKRVPAW